MCISGAEENVKRFVWCAAQNDSATKQDKDKDEQILTFKETFYNKSDTKKK